MTAPAVPGLVRVASLEQAAEVLATARHQSRTSQREVAAVLHVTDGAVGLWEQHKRCPNAEDFLRWCRAVGFDLALLRRSMSGPDNARSEA